METQSARAQRLGWARSRVCKAMHAGRQSSDMRAGAQLSAMQQTGAVGRTWAHEIQGFTNSGHSDTVFSKTRLATSHCSFLQGGGPEAEWR
jgi:hypothetical protein